MSENDLHLALEGGVYRKGVYLKGVAPLLSREVKRLQAEVERLTRERDLLADWSLRRVDTGWCVYGLWETPRPFASRDEAVSALLEAANAKTGPPPRM